MLTYRDYEALPNDGRRYEIHDGELSVTPVPAPKHQIISLNLVLALARHVPSVAPGQLLYAPLDVILADSTKVAEAIIETLQSARQNTLVQKFVKESRGRDQARTEVSGVRRAWRAPPFRASSSPRLHYARRDATPG